MTNRRVARILVIDAEETFRTSLRTLLAGAGYCAIVARDRADGLRRLRQERFDVVISDLFAPANDGLETIGEIRRLLPGTPIIATGGRAGLGPKAQAARNECHLRAARELGATHALMKPFEIAKFLALVQESLGRAG
jgi:CheY-like chemotaxis protein